MLFFLTFLCYTDMDWGNGFTGFASEILSPNGQIGGYLYIGKFVISHLKVFQVFLGNYVYTYVIITVLIKISLETSTWTFWNWLSVIGSGFLWLVINLQATSRRDLNVRQTLHLLMITNDLGFFMFLCLVNSGHQFEYYPLSIWPDRRPKCSHPPCSGLDVSSFHSLPFSATSHTKCKFLLVHQSEPSDRSPVIGPK